MHDLITGQPGPVPLCINHEKELRLQMNAFKSGSAAAMLQTSKLVAYVSKSFNSTKENSVDGQGAVCSIVWLQMSWQVYLSLQSCCESDHEPLEAILKKSLAATPLRL